MQNRLFFLRHWALANQERDAAADVIDYALDILIKTSSDDTPKTRDLREIATPLPSVSDHSKAKKLVGKFDSQKGSIEKFGTTEDFVRLQLLLAQTESKYDFTAACNRIFEAYCHVDDLDDLATKTVCWAWLVALLDDIDPKKELETKEGLHSHIQNELRNDMKNLLNATAEHYFAAHRVIEALAKSNPELALEFAKSLNTQERRDLAVLKFITIALQTLPSNINFTIIKTALDNIVESDYHDESLLRIARRLSGITERLETPAIATIIPLVNSIQHIKDAYKRCIACCYACSFVNEQDVDTYFSLTSDLLNRLESAWKSIDVGWHKVNAGFKIARILAKNSKEIAQKYLKLTEKVKDNVIMDAETPALTYLACVKLAIRAYSGLLPKNINTSDDMERLTRLINRIPSNGIKAELWAELALRCFINEHSDMGKRIVTTHVKPLLQDIFDDTAFKFQVQITVAPALFCAHKETALEIISKMPYYKRDEAYSKICDFLLRKKPPSDPYDYVRGDGFILTFEEVADICKILELMSIDRKIYAYIEFIVDSLTLKDNKSRISEQQRIEIADRLEEIITKKLPDYQTIPDYHNIMHEGYKIIAQAQVARIRRTRTQEWDDLVQKAEAIPNIADKGLVMCMIASAMPSRERSKQRQIITNAISLIDNLPADFDRIDRYIALVDTIRRHNSDLAKKCLKSAMEFSIKLNEYNLMYPNQRRILDVAHRIDPSYAASLTSLVDDDLARGKSKAGVESYLQLLKCKNEMADPRHQKLSAKTLMFYYPKAAWMNLGGLNSGRVSNIHFNSLIEYINDAAELPLRESYPILAWIVENAVQRWSTTDQARTHLFPIFESILLGAELSGRIAERSLEQLKYVKKYVGKTPGISKNIEIKAGERTRALQFLQEWFTQEVRDYLKICDTSFGINDLEILQLLNSTNPYCKCFVLASKKQQKHDKLPPPWDEAFETHWRLKVSDQDPPETEIVIVGIESTGDSPLQDCCWLTNEGGLRISTSFNSLGVTKSSEILILSTEEARTLENEIDQYLRLEKRDYNGERLRYNLFTL